MPRHSHPSAIFPRSEKNSKGTHQRSFKNQEKENVAENLSNWRTFDGRKYQHKLASSGTSHSLQKLTSQSNSTTHQERVKTQNPVLNKKVQEKNSKQPLKKYKPKDVTSSKYLSSYKPHRDQEVDALLFFESENLQLTNNVREIQNSKTSDSTFDNYNKNTSHSNIGGSSGNLISFSEFEEPDLCHFPSQSKSNSNSTLSTSTQNINRNDILKSNSTKEYRKRKTRKSEFMDKKSKKNKESKTLPPHAQLISTKSGAKYSSFSSTSSPLTHRYIPLKMSNEENYNEQQQQQQETKEHETPITLNTNDRKTRDDDILTTSKDSSMLDQQTKSKKKKRKLPSWMKNNSPSSSYSGRAPYLNKDTLKEFSPFQFLQQQKKYQENLKRRKEEKFSRRKIQHELKENLVQGSSSNALKSKKYNIPFISGRVIAFDLETTGFSSSDEIIEIGAVEIRDGEITGVKFHSYINPECEIHSLAYQVHGISQEFLSHHPDAESVIKNFSKWIDDSPLIAHNLSFDYRFLSAALDKYNISSISREKTFCTMSYFRQRFPQRPYDLDAVCHFFGILGNRKRHDALSDAEMTAAVYVELCDSQAKALNNIVMNRSKIDDDNDDNIDNNNNEQKSGKSISNITNNTKHDDHSENIKELNHNTIDEPPQKRFKKTKDDDETFYTNENVKRQIFHVVQTCSTDEIKRIFEIPTSKARMIIKMRPFSNYQDVYERLEKVPCLGYRLLNVAISKFNQ